MNDQVAIRVTSYSGYKTDEYPNYFYWDKNRFEIKEICDRWHQWETESEWMEADYFKVKTTDDKIFLLKHEIKTDAWFLLINKETIQFL